MKETEPVARLNLYDLLLLLVKWRKLFVVNFIIVAIASVIIALNLSLWYSASTIILPPSGGSGGLPSFLPSDLKGVAANFGLDLPTDEIYQTILTSRTLKENIIERFNLREVYEMDEEVFDEDVIVALESHMKVFTRDDAAIVVTLEDRSPERVAEMTNACVEELDRLYSKITSESAHKNRIYIGKRLKQVTDSLAVLQDSIMSFQQSTNAISISDQMMATINAAADIKAEQISKEVELDVMMNSFGAEHPLVEQLKATSRELKRRYLDMTNGTEGDLFLDIKEMPLISRQYAELVRRVRIQASLIEFIYPQFESSRIQEERETANVQVIDRAKVPGRKSRPSRKLVVLIAVFGSFLVTLVLVLLLEYWRKLPEKNAEDWGKIQAIIKPFKGGHN